MIPNSLRHKPILLLLAVILATPCVGAAGLRSAERARPAQALQPAGFDVLSQLWKSLRSLWSEEGCHIDPDGRCVQPPATNDTDTGCGIDPSGRCLSRPAPQSDEGCGIDPDGRCRS